MALTQDDVNRAREIVEEMKNLMYEYADIIRMCNNKMTYERFHAYPKGHIEMALSNDHEYLGSNMFTLEGLCDDMQEEIEPEEGENEEE